MDLCEDICRFLAGNALKYTTEKVCGQDVIYINGVAAVIPARICSNTLETACIQSATIRDAADQVAAVTGEYPFIITEDRWRRQTEMMQSRLLAHLRIFIQIYARNCEVRKIDKSTAASFLEANHSYGYASCRHRYGLFLKRHTGHNAGSVDIEAGTLVAAATFSNARKWIKGDKTIRSYEWTRYASLPQVRVSGGMGKLLKAFIDDVKPDDVMTYADLEWSEGKVYEALGFMPESVKEPVIFRVSASWRRFPVKPGMTEGTSLTGTDMETSLQAATGNLYFQNSGSKKYRLKLTDYQ